MDETREKKSAKDSTEDARQAHFLLYCSLAFYGLCMLTLLVIVVMTVVSSFMPISNLVLLAQMLFLVAAIAGIAGFIVTRVVRNSFSADSDKVLTPAVRELLADPIRSATDPVAEFTRLSGLSGGTGIFRKLELSGMPLATILMTLAFCIFSMVLPALQKQGWTDGGADLAKAFIDMAKLTLGAFIGSFVTKTSSRDTETARVSASAAAKALASTQPAAPLSPSSLALPPDRDSSRPAAPD